MVQTLWRIRWDLPLWATLMQTPRILQGCLADVYVACRVGSLLPEQGDLYCYKTNMLYEAGVDVPLEKILLRYKLWSCSLCSLFRPLVNSFLLLPYIQHLVLRHPQSEFSWCEIMVLCILVITADGKIKDSEMQSNQHFTDLIPS